eukprot:3937668-Rhodomonas_salina.2
MHPSLPFVSLLLQAAGSARGRHWHRRLGVGGEATELRERFERLVAAKELAANLPRGVARHSLAAAPAERRAVLCALHVRELRRRSRAEELPLLVAVLAPIRSVELRSCRLEVLREGSGKGSRRGVDGRRRVSARRRLGPRRRARRHELCKLYRRIEAAQRL